MSLQLFPLVYGMFEGRAGGLMQQLAAVSGNVQSNGGMLSAEARCALHALEPQVMFSLRLTNIRILMGEVICSISR